MSTTQNADASGRRFRRPTLILGTLLLVLAIAAGIAAHYLNPWLKARAVDALREKFHSDVEMRDFEVSFYPEISLHGSGLALRHEGDADAPPLIAIEDFSAQGGFLSAFEKPWKISKVQLKGLQINIVPGLRKRSRDWSKVRNVPVLIGELISDDAQLNIYSKTPGKEPRVFAIHHLHMHSVGLDRAAEFSAKLTNPTPPGEIETEGKFGPWNSDEPSQTPLHAGFSFANADLSVFKGIGGILSSTGRFGGVLGQIEVQGETKTPNFVVSIAGHPVELTTLYSATVDGTNGNTLLHPVQAKFLHSSLTANGGVVGSPGIRGKTVTLDVAAQNGRLEDFLRLVVKTDQPVMTGALNFHTKFDLPPGKEDIIERLKLNGTFGVMGGQFTNAKVVGKLETLSRKGQGKPNDKEAGSAVSDLRGRFALGGSRITFSDLTFSVPGASVLLNGSYGLKDEQLDFHGKLRLQARVSQTVTGYKSFLLRPFDPMFRKNNATELPIKITGTRSSPSFGLDFGRKQQSR